jgi:hypothetical protein
LKISRFSVLFLASFAFFRLTPGAASAPDAGEGKHDGVRRMGPGDLFAEPQTAYELLSRYAAPRILGDVMRHSVPGQTETVWFLRTRLIVPGCPLPDGRDMAELAKRGDGNAPALRVLDEVMRCTEPHADNYKDFLIIPQGLRIRFVHCRFEERGMETPVVDIPLKELEKAGPRREAWKNAGK